MQFLIKTPYSPFPVQMVEFIGNVCTCVGPILCNRSANGTECCAEKIARTKFFGDIQDRFEINHDYDEYFKNFKYIPKQRQRKKVCRRGPARLFVAREVPTFPKPIPTDTSSFPSTYICMF